MCRRSVLDYGNLQDRFTLQISLFKETFVVFLQSTLADQGTEEAEVFSWHRNEKQKKINILGIFQGILMY
jgi:hypothetical protein